MMNTFLTEQEVRELTGSARKAEQSDMLRRQGINHFVRKDGRPMVTWYQVNHPYITTEVRGDQPDFDALIGSDVYA